jgi:TonB family protein
MFIGNKVDGQLQEISAPKEDTVKINDSTYIIKQYHENKGLIFVLSLRSVNPEERHGKYMSYHENGKINCRGQYYHNVPFGKWIYFDDQGNQLKVLDYDKALDLFNNQVDTAFYVFVEEQALFNDGDINTFREYFQNHLTYPDYALKRNITGRVTLQFAVYNDGRIVNPKILRGIITDLELEAIRVCAEAPKWKPARQNNQPVGQQFVIPVIFNPDYINQNVTVKSSTYKVRNKSK